MSNEKERSMKTTKDIFTLNKGSVSNREIFEVFRKIAVLTAEHWMYSEILQRRGDNYSPVPVNVSMNMAQGGQNNSAHLVNLPDLARDAIIEAQKHRIIYNHNAEGIYRVVDDKASLEEGVYVITHKSTPKFKIDIKDKGQWIASPMVFSGLEAECTTQCTTNFEESPYKANIITTVPARSRSEIESSTKKIFQGFHSSLKSEYETRGAISSP